MSGVLGLALALCCGPSLAVSPAAGVWATPEEHGQVEVRDCGSALCGFILDGDHLRADPGVKDLQNRNPALRGRTLKGLPIFERLTGGPPKWRGKVYNPVDGGLYSGSVTLKSPDVLVLTGCIVWPLCQSQTWRRVR